ncbi:bifunctional hydroxymethylpyrimidine kinase/phosphomethylpyrimidine kinase [Haloferula sp.]|uniref:bifunctional hydroxymethylpyrimidine kinase/phosphomethylpyrimidine kinase n=1 Tax=Haloferula sp. TaxID=2497595 RepID=UPI0032A074D6
MTPVALSIAGSDCSSGAGLQADLKTFQHFQCYGLNAVTCVVAETPDIVQSFHPVPPAILQDQLMLMLESYPVAAIKTGMLYSKAHVVAISELLASHPDIPLVVDPVMVASTGDPLLRKDAIQAYRGRLLPLATLITPNLDEAEVLVGRPIRDENAIEQAAVELAEHFRTSILLKGGHLDSTDCADLLCEKGELKWFRSPRIDTPASHGTGCTLSAAITARLAQGDDLATATEQAKSYLNQTLNEALTLGKISHLNQGTTLKQTPASS